MWPSRVFMVCVAFGLGAVWSVLVMSLMQAAKRGDELNEQAWHDVDLEEARNN